MARRQTGIGAVVVVGIVLGLIALLIWLAPQSIRYQQTEQQCRFRLRRVGEAINAWVMEHGRERFPPVRNPAPRQLWRPGRPDSLSAILRPYLSGDDDLFRPRRIGDKRIPSGREQDESENEYVQRLRQRELTCCPTTGFPYWYNALDLQRNDPDRLGVRDPTVLAPGPSGTTDELVYLHCQPTAEGAAPHQLDDGPGHHAAIGSALVRQVLPEHVAEERERLRRAEQVNAGRPIEEWTVDLLAIRSQVEALERRLERHPEGFVVTRLQVEVRAIPGVPPVAPP
ncbi:MAG: hypothetical protein ACOCXJ_03455 [Planctomycetota bacterium]